MRLVRFSWMGLLKRVSRRGGLMVRKKGRNVKCGEGRRVFRGGGGLRERKMGMVVSICGSVVCGKRKLMMGVGRLWLRGVGVRMR